MQYFWPTIVLAAAITAMTGCQLTQPQSPVVPAPIQPPVDVSVVEPPPKLITTDWRDIISPLIDELLSTMAVSSNNTLLISDVNNRSGQYVSPTTINQILIQALSQQTIFEVVDNKTVTLAKQNLGIASDDSLVSRGKMVALARQVNADYVLFTTIERVADLPATPAEVSLELILTKTGEIVWQFSSQQLADRQNQNQ